MSRLLVKFAAEQQQADPFELEAPDVVLALVIAEIGTRNGPTEIWNRTKRLARLRKRGPEGATFWEVG